MTGKVQLRNRADIDALFAARMTVSELDQTIRDECKHLGLRCFSLRGSRFAVSKANGWPHLTIASSDRLMYAVVKAGTQQPTAEEYKWAATLANASQQWRAWRPGDWISGVIQAELRQMAGQTIPQNITKE